MKLKRFLSVLVVTLMLVLHLFTFAFAVQKPCIINTVLGNWQKKATLTTGLKENDLNYIKVKIDSGDVNTVYCNVYVMGEDGTYILEDWAVVPNDSTTHRYYYLGGSKPSEGTDLGLKGYQKNVNPKSVGGKCVF